ncbi:hypothetical protein Tco_0975008 [Tanacetum coccineum]|uniref:Uncharacterized protein n=1 Tax=Tanacetum coccineum TaxID=301880 RepID=A0ABQ5EDE2_9ASTR
MRSHTKNTLVVIVRHGLTELVLLLARIHKRVLGCHYVLLLLLRLLTVLDGVLVLPLVMDDEEAKRIVRDKELLSNMVEALVDSLNDDSLRRSMVLVVSKEGRVLLWRMILTRVANLELSPLTV